MYVLCDVCLHNVCVSVCIHGTRRVECPSYVSTACLYQSRFFHYFLFWCVFSSPNKYCSFNPTFSVNFLTEIPKNLCVFFPKTRNFEFHSFRRRKKNQNTSPQTFTMLFFSLPLCIQTMLGGTLFFFSLFLFFTLFYDFFTFSDVFSNITCLDLVLVGVFPLF